MFPVSLRAIALPAMLLAASTLHLASAETTATYHIYDGIRPEQTFCNLPYTSIDRITAYKFVGTDLKCGDCVEITNVRTNSKLVVQVVDKGGNIFDLSKPAFDALDTDKQGYNDGHMSISYKKTACSGSSSSGSSPKKTKKAKKAVAQ